MINNEGKHNPVWNATQHGCGVYYFKLTAGDQMAVRRGVLRK